MWKKDILTKIDLKVASTKLRNATLLKCNIEVDTKYIQSFKSKNKVKMRKINTIKTLAGLKGFAQNNALKSSNVDDDPFILDSAVSGDRA